MVTSGEVEISEMSVGARGFTATNLPMRSNIVDFVAARDRRRACNEMNRVKHPEVDPAAGQAFVFWWPVVYFCPVWVGSSGKPGC